MRTRTRSLAGSEDINRDVQQAKPIIDCKDILLRQFYGFDEDDLDFLLNFDITYRSARDTEAIGQP